MALPPGCAKRCRPARKRVRRYTAKDVGRIACKAMSQGVSRGTIYREIEERCGKGVVCDCEKVAALLPEVLKALALAVAVASLVIPALRIIRLAITVARRIPEFKHRLDRLSPEETAKALENAQGAKRVLEGEFTRVDDMIMEILKAEVKIKP